MNNSLFIIGGIMRILVTIYLVRNMRGEGLFLQGGEFLV